MKPLNAASAAALFLFSITVGCDVAQFREQSSEEILNSMTLRLNDSSYVASGVYGEKANSMGSSFCIGYIRGNRLLINMKINDTAAIGSGYYDIDHSVTYSITYGLFSAVANSGVIMAERYTHNKASRVKGSFYCLMVHNGDTLRCTEGRFDVYMRESEEP